MKTIFTSIFLVLLVVTSILAQDTFSIVAVDTATKEVGSAGASCINGCVIISDLHPGRGAIHTQASYYYMNQTNAKNRMNEGMPPQEIISWLVANDALGDATVRQYGIVDFDSLGSPRSAGYTGTNCFDYKSHIAGYNYSIQGNILLGQEILDSIEAGFLNATGTLADKLMAALQGANVVGADTRCMSNGTSSLSAFLRVAKPTDGATTPYINLNVNSTPAGKEPIDSLQKRYDEWKGVNGLALYLEAKKLSLKIFPNPAKQVVNFEWAALNSKSVYHLSLENVLGQTVKNIRAIDGNKIKISLEGMAAGIYFYKFAAEEGLLSTGKIIIE